MDGAAPEVTPQSALPARTFEVDGVSWIARDTGRTAIGSDTSPRAALMQVSFCREESPEQIEFDALVAMDSLELMGVDQLTVLLAGGRPRSLAVEPSRD